PDLRYWWSSSRDGCIMKTWRDYGPALHSVHTSVNGRSYPRHYASVEADPRQSALVAQESDGVARVVAIPSDTDGGQGWIWSASCSPAIKQWVSCARLLYALSFTSESSCSSMWKNQNVASTGFLRLAQTHPIIDLPMLIQVHMELE